LSTGPKFGKPTNDIDARFIGGDNRMTDQRRFYQVNGLNMYVEEYGYGTPLILLHGGTATSDSWKPFLSEFEPHFRMITPDSRGHGRTDNPAGELGYRLMADDVAALIQASNLSRPFVFGYSDGGQIALELGMNYPGLTGALVVGAAWYKFSQTYVDVLHSAGFEEPGMVNIEKIQRDSPEWVEELKREHIHSNDPDYWKVFLKQISGMWWTPLDYTEDDFKKITEPTLILLGDRDGIVELEQAVDMYHLIPNAELAIVPNANHFTAINDLSVSIVLDFLLRQV
jgi:pimeloyl-ACP methyl ester carboxylesterase